VNAEAAIPVESVRPRWRRRLAVMARRSGWAPIAEFAIVVVLLLVLAGSYFIVTRIGTPEVPLSPELVAALVVANLVPAMALMVMVARRLAIRRAVRSDIGGKGRLHVRLVALFSIIASVPTLLVVIFASLLFQSGVRFWFSDQSRTVLASAQHVAEIYEREHRERIALDVRVMGGDVVRLINRYGLDSDILRGAFLYQTAVRQLQEAAILTVDPDGRVGSHVVEVNFDNRPLASRFPAAVLRSMRAGELRFASTPNRVEAVVRLDPQALVYLYGARYVNPRAIAQVQQARTATSNYRSTLENTRRLQIRFNVVLILVSLALIALSIWIALIIADRMVRPIGQLVDAARRVTGGDLAARVPVSEARDEVGTLGSTFNRMTRRLEEQTGALVSANAQLDSRRAFTEAVLSGVTAGVISVDEAHVVRLINSSAEALLKTGGKGPVGQRLADLAPELDRQLAAGEREDVVQLSSTGEPRTLAVKTVKVQGGHVLTFDDITEQLMDQRRAAWSDVARRIAHEIKNPLTPIQLAAERLQRRYGGEVTSDPATFERLTGTIVRQVGDLRRMVDEFSSFARMPKPAFAAESLAEIARQALFLHEVAHPDIAFALDVPDPAPVLVCDRRLLGQALTNVVKNGVEAIQQKREEKKRGKAGGERVAIAIGERGPKVTIEITDSGVGLPAERARMTEPYMTTRAKGTGLGLAIVKKIVEEHFGQIEFEDAPGGGSLVRMIFDRETLGQLAATAPSRFEEKLGSG
jgi:two-component system nitrogen regulation sensor histidine kinase NtrY